MDILKIGSALESADLILQELFGAIGDMKKARLVKAGTAEVIYKERGDAQMAVKKYHQRELDGMYQTLDL